MKMTSFAIRQVASCVINRGYYERFSEKIWGQWKGESLELIQTGDDIAELEAAFKSCGGKFEPPQGVDPSRLEPDRVVSLAFDGNGSAHAVTARGRIFWRTPERVWEEAPGPTLPNLKA